VEYGLIGTPENPKIYGAGLLSSIGESSWCMTEKVSKIPYSIEAAHTSFDITKPQPQLFVTPDFAYLSQILEEFANTMALRKGGLDGLEKLIASQALGTVELSTGLQISGVFSRAIAFEDKPAYLMTSGPTALAYREKELIGHSTVFHPDGFGAPIGKLKGINLAIEDMSPRDLKAYKIYEAERVNLEFEGGIRIEGEIITGTRNLRGEIILITFRDCTVRHQDEVLFQPEWGLYHMAVGEKIVSAFNGPADLSSFDLISHVPAETTIKVHKDPRREQLEKLYGQIREFREGTNTTISRNKVFQKLKSSHPEDWMLPVEIYELARADQNEEFASEILQHLEEVKRRRPEVGHLIDGGIALVDAAKVIR
jgi:phenylalanine-4-hydroxylase